MAGHLEGFRAKNLITVAEFTAERDAIEYAENLLGHRIAFLTVAKEIAYSHHEKWDGSGYPQALQGEQIPLVARITTLVDVYDALRSKRAYKLAFSHAQAMTILLEGDGRTIPQHFDPQLLELFDKHQHEFKEIYELLKD